MCKKFSISKSSGRETLCRNISENYPAIEQDYCKRQQRDTGVEFSTKIKADKPVLAERVGFEPTRDKKPLTVFETVGLVYDGR